MFLLYHLYILNLNESYFKEFGDEIIEAPEGKIYIFAYDSKSFGNKFQIFMTPKITGNLKYISRNVSPLQMYFSNASEYILDLLKVFFE